MTTIALVPLARAAADCGVQRAHSRAQQFRYCRSLLQSCDVFKSAAANHRSESIAANATTPLEDSLLAKVSELDTLQTQQKQDIQKIQKEINLQRYIEDVALASASDRLKVSHFNE